MQISDMEHSKIKIEVAVIEGRSDVKIVRIEGVLDPLTIQQAEKDFSPLIEEKKHLIVDCTKLTFVNSLGLAFLMKCHIQMKKRNGSFKLVNFNKLIRDLLEICGVSNFLEVYSSLQEAIRSLEKK